MRKKMTTIIKGTKIALGNWRGWFVFGMAFLAFGALFVWLPVVLTPGNDLAFQITITKPSMWAVIAFLSIMNALIVVFNYHLLHRGLKSRRAGAAGLSSVAVSLVAALGCVACHSGILTVIGLSGAAIIVKSKFWIVLITAALGFLSVGFVAEKITAQGDGCQAGGIDK